MIYIISSDKITGGPELLHQCAYYLKKKYPNSVKLFYTHPYEKDDNNFSFYSKYISKEDIITSIPDDEQNIVIVPETFTGYLKGYKNVKKVIWWLSVDNYFLNYGENIYTLKGKVFMFLRRIKRKFYYKTDAMNLNEIKTIKNHWFQSSYAMLVLGNLGVKGNLVGDYLEKSFFADLDSDLTIKENYILYNPKKGFNETKKIIDFYNRSNNIHNHKFIPLVNLNRDELKLLLKKAKVYLDFGYHPGKDRMPREAAISGCIVITNTKGSAGNNEDIPISLSNKFQELNDDGLKGISDKISDILVNYQAYYNDNFDYRNTIENSEEQFQNDLSKAIEQVK